MPVSRPRQGLVTGKTRTDPYPAAGLPAVEEVGAAWDGEEEQMKGDL